MRVRIEGFDALERDLTARSQAARDAVFKGVRNGGQAIENRAKVGIAKGPKTGKLYYRGRKKPHQASAPGQYPAADTGNLMRSIRHYVARETDTALTVILQAAAKYAKPLEYKPPERGGRPFLRRAAQEERASIFADIERRLRATGG